MAYHPNTLTPVSNGYSHYGQHLTRLGMDECPQLLQQLPCPNLLELLLGWSTVQLGPRADSSGVFQGCTKLTKLVMRVVHDTSAEGGVLDSLSSLVHLQHLEYLLEDKCALSSATLPRMQQLTYLDAPVMSEDNLLQLGALTSLQELHLHGTSSNAPVGPSSVPCLVLPAALTRLVLLSSVEAGLLSIVPTGLQDLRLECDIIGPAEGPSSLLSGMARLQHLTQLYIDGEEGLHLQRPPAGPAYAALTVSSNLVSLVLHSLKLPACAWRHVFPATHKLPHLTCLAMHDECLWGAVPLASAWGVADVCNLVSCCPNMCSFLGVTMQHGPHVSELQKLKDLTDLEIFYCRDSITAFEQSFKGLAAVTQLQGLHVDLDNSDLSVASLLPLTSLTALRGFTCWAPTNAIRRARLEVDCYSSQVNWPYITHRHNVMYLLDATVVVSSCTCHHVLALCNSCPTTQHILVTS
jgi:hypothetical protein